MASKPILPKQRLFIAAYVDCLNGAEAARRAGYSPKSAAVQASTLRSQDHIRKEIDRLLEKQSRMGKDEILAKLERQANADISIFFDAHGTLLWDVVHKNGDLIQRIWVTAEGPRLMLHDSQKALELLGKSKALFVEREIWKELEGMEIRDGGKGNGKAPRRALARASREAAGD